MLELTAVSQAYTPADKTSNNSTSRRNLPWYGTRVDVSQETRSHEECDWPKVVFPDKTPGGDQSASQPRGRGRPRKSLKCDYCPKIFKNRNSLLYHGRMHHRQLVQSKSRGRGRTSESFKCEYCPQTFKNQNNLDGHINRLHTRESLKTRARSQGSESSEHSIVDDERQSADSEYTNLRKTDGGKKSVALQSVCSSVLKGLRSKLLKNQQKETQLTRNPRSRKNGKRQPSIKKEDIASSQQTSIGQSAGPVYDGDADLVQRLYSQYPVREKCNSDDEYGEDQEHDSDSDYEAPRVRKSESGRGSTEEQMVRTSLLCDFCPQLFKTKRQVWNHMQICHQDELGPEQRAKEPVKQKGRPRMSRMCDYCPKIFTKRGSVITHMRTAHPKEMNYTPKSYLCSQCGNSFSTQITLKYHMRRHQGVRPFKCDKCAKTFITAGDLKDHVQGVHLGLRPFLCTLCGAAFKRHYALKCHLRAHSGQREHSCSVCGKAFKERHQLNRHLALHNSEKPYECQFCQAKYGHKGGLRIHLQRSKACPGSSAVKVKPAE